MPGTNSPTCGKWMPQAKGYCALKPGHKTNCRTAKAAAEYSRRKSSRRWGVHSKSDPVVKARYTRNHKFVRLGITEEDFNQMLEAQGRACAMCHKPFADGDRIFADHDHTCCPAQVKTTAKTCGKCIRGLLCFRCNTSLGYIEKYGQLARAYLDQVAARVA